LPRSPVGAALRREFFGDEVVDAALNISSGSLLDASRRLFQMDG
jgi:hypothetical protein